MLKKIRSLCIFLPKMSAYRRDFDETKYMSFLILFFDILMLLEKYDKFKCKKQHQKKYLKAKIKSCNGKNNTNFHSNKMLNEYSQFICLSAILIDYVSRTGKNYYPQVFLEDT